MSRKLSKTVVHKGVVYAAGTSESDIDGASKIGANVWDSEAKAKAEPSGYGSRDKDDLQAELDERNAALGDDAQIEVTGTGANGNVVEADLVKALEADDAAKA